MNDCTDNIIMKRSINGFCINMVDWFYEGQTVNISDKQHGLLSQVTISSVPDNSDEIMVRGLSGKEYRINLEKVLDVVAVHKQTMTSLLPLQSRAEMVL